jgi:uncharacterized protein DUF4336
MASTVGAGGTYDPLDVEKPVADGIWVVDSGPLHVFGLALPVRMTVVRLASGDLWLHSPTRFSEDLRARLQRHGRIRHLIAPDVAHWSFIKDWQRGCPDTLTWAAPGLRERRPVRKAGLTVDHVLSDQAPPDWADAMDQVTVRGLGFSEVDFFHRATRTLIVTDLIQNLEPFRLPPLTRMMSRLIGAAASSGRPPVYLRLAVLARKRDAARAAGRLVKWAPERVIFSHGRWFESEGTEKLKRSLGWLIEG